jgi:hypothetical protein
MRIKVTKRRTDFRETKAYILSLPQELHEDSAAGMNAEAGVQVYEGVTKSFRTESIKK